MQMSLILIMLPPLIEYLTDALEALHGYVGLADEYRCGCNFVHEYWSLNRCFNHNNRPKLVTNALTIQSSRFPH